MNQVTTGEPVQTFRTRLAELLGLTRSLVIYHGLPWRRRALLQFYHQLIDSDALVFDIGAHVGNRTRTLAALGARCIAVEPQPLFTRLLTRWFNGNERVTIVAQAIGRTTGVAQLRISRRHPTVSTLSSEWIDKVHDTDGFEHVHWDHVVDVPITTLDKLIAQYGQPDFCKIDVEGMESEILAGLSTPIPLVAIEYIPAALDIARACIAQLDNLGEYVFNLSPGENHRMLLDTWVDSTALLNEIDKASIAGQSGDLYARLVRPPTGTRLRSIAGLPSHHEEQTRNTTQQRNQAIENAGSDTRLREQAEQRPEPGSCGFAHTPTANGYR